MSFNKVYLNQKVYLNLLNSKDTSDIPMLITFSLVSQRGKHAPCLSSPYLYSEVYQEIGKSLNMAIYVA